MTTPEQQAAILADEPWIGALIERLKAGADDVYWRDQENRLLRVLRVQLDWVEFTDDPNPVAEPAAFLDGGAIVALWNTNPENFVVSAPALQHVPRPNIAQKSDTSQTQPTLVLPAYDEDISPKWLQLDRPRELIAAAQQLRRNVVLPGKLSEVRVDVLDRGWNNQWGLAFGPAGWLGAEGDERPRRFELAVDKRDIWFVARINGEEYSTHLQNLDQLAQQLEHTVAQGESHLFAGSNPDQMHDIWVSYHPDEESDVATPDTPRG